MTKVTIARKLRALGLLALSVGACNKSEPDEPAAEMPTGAAARATEAAKVAAPPPPPVATTPPPRPKAKIAPFAESSKTLAKRCTPKLADNASNVEAKANMAQTADCLKKAFTADLDLVLVPTKSVDPNRFNALMREQAGWNKLTEDLCWLSEEAFWIDLEHGTRDDGTMRGIPSMQCKQQAAVERDYYAVALKADDAAALAGRIEELATPGKRSRDTLAQLQKQATNLAAKPLRDGGVGSFPRQLDAKERAELVTRPKSIEEKAAELAHSTCTWAALAETLGGSGACEEAAGLYYLAHATLEGNKGH